MILISMLYQHEINNSTQLQYVNRVITCTYVSYMSIVYRLLVNKDARSDFSCDHY